MLPLESLCLDTTVKNFHLLNLAFKVSKDARMQRNFKFLQRRYTEYLARKLLEDEKNTDEYFDLLINENLKYLEFDCFRNSPYLDSIDDIFCRLPRLTRLSFSICCDDVLKSVAKFCPDIVEIIAPDSVLSDKGVKHLCERRNGKAPCPKLKNIFVRNSLVTDSGVKHLLQHLPLIERLECDYLPLALHSLHNENLFDSLNVLSYNLLELNLRECVYLPYFTDVIRTCLTVCPKLESISCQVFEREQLDAFNCKCLKKLDLKMIGDYERMDIDNLLKVNGRNLTFLKIANCAVSASVLAEHCPALEVLELISIHLTHVNAHLTFPNLSKCSILGASFRSVIIFNLFFLSSPRLEFLSFQSINLEPELKIEHFINNGSSVIKTIEFCRVRLPISYVRSLLLNYSSLKEVLLRECAYDVPNVREILNGLPETLPNRPVVKYERQQAGVLRVIDMSAEDHPEGRDWWT